MTRILVAFLVLAFYGHLLFGCAHVASVATTCVANGPAVETVLSDLQQDTWSAKLDALAKAIGPCIVRSAVEQVIASLSGSQALEMTGTPSSAEIVSRGRAWLTANPK